MAATTEEMTIDIPLQGSDQTLTLEMGAPLEDIILVMTEEKAKHSFWLQIARYYHQHGMYDKFSSLLEAATQVRVVHTNPEERSDNIKIYTLQVAHLVEQAKAEQDDDKRKKLFQKATSLCNKADRLDMYNNANFVAKGFLKVYQGTKPERALENFTFVLTSDPTHVPALLGKAGIEFNMGRYKAALKDYRTVLRLLPACPAAIRVGIGMCLARLGRFEKARAAFERAVELEPTNPHALAGLAVLALNTKNAASTQAGVHLLTKAYEADTRNPVVLNHLANHFFYKKEYEKAQNLALHAMSSGGVPEMRAESLYHVARVFHAETNYDEAFKYYYQATITAPDFILPQYGLGQMYIARGELTNACACFERVLKQQPDNYETLRILGSLYGQDPAVKAQAKAASFLSKVVKLHPEDVEAWMELAARQEAREHKPALLAYTKARGILAELEMPIPPEMSNNMGCLQFALGQLEQAAESFLAADGECESLVGQLEAVEDQAYYQGLRVTVAYNTARLHEVCSRTDEAIAIYKEIIQNYPRYMDARMRLGCVAGKGGQHRDASDHFKEIVRLDPKNKKAWSLLGNLHYSKEEWKPAQDKFEHILKILSDSDSYSLVALGNVYLRADKLDRAATFFSKVMRHDKHNVYAANGIGCVLACKGHLQQAKDIFVNVREATGGAREVVDAWLNLAHIYVHQEQYVDAIKLYETCLDRFLGGNHVPTLAYLARAYFKAGKFRECKVTLQRSLHVNPRDDRVRFNLALTQQRHAMHELQQAGHTLTEVNQALQDLTDARSMFMHLKAPAGKTKYDPARAATEAKRCDDYISQGKTLQTRAAEMQRQRDEVAAQRAASRQAILDRTRQQELDRRQREAEEEEERKQRLAMHDTKVKAMGALTPKAPEPKEPKAKRGGGGGGGGGGRRKKTKADEQFIDDGTLADDLAAGNLSVSSSEASGSDASGGEGGKGSIRSRGRKALKGVREKKRRSKEGRKASKRSKAGAGDTGKVQKKPKLERQGGESSSSEDEAWFEEEAKKAAATHRKQQVAQKKSALSKATISDSDESDTPLLGKAGSGAMDGPPGVAVARKKVDLGSDSE